MGREIEPHKMDLMVVGVTLCYILWSELVITGASYSWKSLEEAVSGCLLQPILLPCISPSCR